MAVQKTNLSKMSFEDALEELENIVRDLESGNCKLEDSIDAYERVRLFKSTAKKNCVQHKCEWTKYHSDERDKQRLSQ